MSECRKLFSETKPKPVYSIIISSWRKKFPSTSRVSSVYIINIAHFAFLKFTVQGDVDHVEDEGW